MKKKLVTVLVIIAIVLILGIAGALGFVWYRDNHVFVEGDAYPLNSQQIDLREKDVGFDYFLALQQALPECEIVWNVPFPDGVRVSSDAAKITVNPNLSDADCEILLNYFPNLKTIEAVHTGSQMNYQALENLAGARPDWEVLYEVDLGGVRFAPDAGIIDLQVGDYTFETMLRNLAYLPQLTHVNLHTPELTTEQWEQLKAAYPEMLFTCTVEIFHVEYDTRTTELDLSEMTDSNVQEIAEKLVLLPALEYVKLGDLSKESVKALMAAAPNVVFDYTFEFFGETLTTASEEVKLANVKIGDDNEAEVRLALDLLGNCKRMVLDNCHMSDEVLAKIRDDYRGRTKVVWRVWFGGGSCLTDAEIIRCTYDLLDDNCADLYWCEDVRFVDFGHNEWLDGCDFIAGMKSLEYCILSGAPIKSLEPFANCKNLKFLEVAFCEYIESVEPLKNCTQLQMLNIANTHALDLTPLDNLPLTHFGARCNPSGKSRISADEQARFRAQHPDCWTEFEGAQPYGVGWRYGEDEITPLPQYEIVQLAFKLPHAPNNTGWYLDDATLEKYNALHPAVTETAVEETVPAETVAEETVPAETVAETIAE